MEGSENERGGFGKMNYGCEHYRRRCKIRAPCCNRIFDCRYCHIEAMSKLSDPSEWHELARNAIKQVVCSVCGREQPVARICTNCGVNMGEYFCDICKLYDDDIQKGHFHCTDCGICRVGGRENFFHCEKCGTCYALHLRDRHVCVENSMRHNCPICCEVCFVCPASDIKKLEKVCDFSYTIKPCICKYLFDSRKGTTIMKCGHTIHCECYNKMVKHRVRCPICSGLLVDVPGP